MKTLSLLISALFVFFNSSCSSLSKIKDEKYSSHSEINSISTHIIYKFKNVPVIDTTKLDPKYKEELILYASLWKKIRPGYQPKNDEWKYGYVEINVLNNQKVNFVLKNSTGKIVDKKNHKYVNKNNFIELKKQVIADPLYIVIWTLGSQRLALGLNNKNNLILLKKQGAFAMLLVAPTFWWWIL